MDEKWKHRLIDPKIDLSSSFSSQDQISQVFVKLFFFIPTMDRSLF